jgi:hypothetical protein
MKTQLTLEVQYDPDVTDPEGLAVALDRLLETACSTPGILDEYGNPMLGEFLVTDSAAKSRLTKARQIIENLLNTPDLNLDEREPYTETVILRAQAFLAASETSQAHDGTEATDSRKYVLYDYDLDELATTRVYDTAREAADDANPLHNVLVLALPVSASLTDSVEEDDETIEGRCDCQRPGYFYSGVPGIIARVRHGRLVIGAEVQRCDLCRRYPSDQAAFDKLVELEIARRRNIQDDRPAGDP